MPVTEAKCLLVGSSAGCYVYGSEHETNEARNLHCAADDLRLAKPPHIYQIDGKNEDKTDGDNDCWGDVAPK